MIITVEKFYDISGNISVIILATIVVTGIRKYRLLSENEKWYFYYTAFIAVIEAISYSITYCELALSKATLYPVYIAGEFFVVTGIFLKKLKAPKYCFPLTALISLFILLADKLIPGYINDFSKAFSNIGIIVLAMLSLLSEIRNGDGKNHFLNVEKMLFLYFSVSIFIFVFQYQLFKLPKKYFDTIWVINNVMLCVFYSVILYTFLRLKK